MTKKYEEQSAGPFLGVKAKAMTAKELELAKNSNFRVSYLPRRQLSLLHEAAATPSI